MVSCVSIPFHFSCLFLFFLFFSFRIPLLLRRRFKVSFVYLFLPSSSFFFFPLFRFRCTCCLMSIIGSLAIGVYVVVFISLFPCFSLPPPPPFSSFPFDIYIKIRTINGGGPGVHVGVVG
ncbi:hypothetical protein DFH27DRAFT_331244 [Peziza echinospora]|nr:hypothetical protein DFH27DRAFT_331244 [Peziza echinospora]